MYVKPVLWILLLVSVQEGEPNIFCVAFTVISSVVIGIVGVCVHMFITTTLTVCAPVFLQESEYDYGTYKDLQPLNCSTTESIKGGHVTYSQCAVLSLRLGRYPSPVSYRTCSADGEWSSMRLPSGREVSRATCKDVLCPAQLQLDHGDLWPWDQWLHVGATQSFFCQEGFILSGSAQRNCTLTGEWTGTTPVYSSDDCYDPGIPPGAQRYPGRFYMGQKVTYWCQAGMDLLGSAERVCLENREWSGSTPRCQAPNTFDSLSVVAAVMAGSLAGKMDVLSPDAKQESDSSFGRTFRVAEGSRVNVFILLDTSGGITKEDFEKSREATIALIRTFESYEVQLKFHVVTVFITTGTNLHAALKRVSEMIAFLKQNSATNHFNETQNIIVIETDGFTNTGSKPQLELARLRSLLGYHNIAPDHTQETMLDVYVFGIGDQVKRDQLNSLASKKRGEEHVFVLKDYETLGAVFNSIISDKSVTMCGVAQEHISKKQKEDVKGIFTKPWHVSVKSVGSTPCVGSIVSRNWVLTAAHCFARASEGAVVPKKVIMHPKYKRALRHRNVSEFYDYDVALVQVNMSIPLSWKARPICLPCTVPASRAMKRVNSTCQQHREELLPDKETAAFFIHKNSLRKGTYIQTGSQRPGCVEKAKQTLKEPTNVTLEEYVPDRFLCSGGSSGYHYTISCKGDSGGSLFLEKRKRYFQVGYFSTHTRKQQPPLRHYRSDKPPPDARDFHIDLFKIMPWLKRHLKDEIQFLPDIE
uniref:C3/C5 convertase n=1 Tax=Labrus bergylta TaxID=56723 RepID=A0A3Q3F848_9LABR